MMLKPDTMGRNTILCAMLLSITAIIFLPIVLRILSNYLGLGSLQVLDYSNSGNTSRKLEVNVTVMKNSNSGNAVKKLEDSVSGINNSNSGNTSRKMEDSASNLYQILQETDNLIEFRYIGKNLTRIKPDAFLTQKNLRFLYLSNNPLVIDPGQIWIYHSGITYLDISDANLPVLDPVVFRGLTKLKVVNMQGNRGCGGSKWKALLAGAQYIVVC